MVNEPIQIKNAAAFVEGYVANSHTARDYTIDVQLIF